jgi:hypothetical protein
MTSQHRRRHIATATELARDLRFAAGRFDELALRELDPGAMWSALQLDPELVARFRNFLEKLWFDGIRSRFFAEFDASKLVLPIAPEIADRLDKLVEELEMQAAALDEHARGASASELRSQN